MTNIQEIDIDIHEPFCPLERDAPYELPMVDVAGTFENSGVPLSFLFLDQLRQARCIGEFNAMLSAYLTPSMIQRATASS